MKEKLMNAIRETIIDLKENRRDYNWGITTSCNCGVLAQNILRIDSQKLRNELQNRSNSWAMLCTYTGEGVVNVFIKLYSVGLTNRDLIDLERLENKHILAECGEACLDERLKSDVIKYFEAWLRILEREAAQEIQPPQPLPAQRMTYTSLKEIEEKTPVYQN